jgi:hypothetical protein
MCEAQEGAEMNWEERNSVVVGIHGAKGFEQLVLWDGDHIPLVGDTLMLIDTLRKEDRGWYQVVRRVWKPILRKPSPGESMGTAIRLSAHHTFLDIVVKKVPK